MDAESETEGAPMISGRHQSPDKAYVREKEERPGCCDCFLVTIVWIFFLLTFPITVFYVFKIVKTYERAVVLRLGRVSRRRGNTVVGAGVHFVLPWIDNLLKVDLRTRVVQFTADRVLTKDALPLRIRVAIYQRVTDPATTLLRVEDPAQATELLSNTQVRKIVGNYELLELMSARDEVSKKLCEALEQSPDMYGVQTERIEIVDVELSSQMAEAISAEAQALRVAKAKLIAAQSEVDASEKLKQAALEIANCPTALQLRYLQTLSDLGSQNSSTIVFPLPMELLSALGWKKDN